MELEPFTKNVFYAYARVGNADYQRLHVVRLTQTQHAHNVETTSIYNWSKVNTLNQRCMPARKFRTHIVLYLL